ncbi:DUF790 family protein [Halorhabdus sp. BNX81]|uniref:DUF790 family protein n=1 Tax=Halorhabdus sp. BNX81 TaxID=2980181 RepID=UPI0023DD340F|nr:DUF790 family protein [Halorhabdus sp. BNX81]WEL21291.1 Nuclease of restriction endonuclease-like fold, implicated in nucleotide excision repair [Halorhabdus sp. BNX81]
MLSKDLLRVSRAGGGYQPQFVDEEHRDLAARVIGVFQGHVGERREALTAALTDLERDSDDFKLVRGFAKLLERDATFETRAPLPPARARRATFEAAESVGVVTEDEREQALRQAADRLGSDRDAVASSLYADLEARQILAAIDRGWTPTALLEQYNLSLAGTALFDATAVRIRSSDPTALVSAVKRFGLLYEVERTGDGTRELHVTGPDALFESTRRYGTQFARLLRSVAKTAEWRLEATIDDDGRERTMTLTDADVSVPDVEPVVEPTYDSDVEADFATRFASLDLPWELVREPEPLEAGASVAIPDFAFEYRHGDFRVFFEIMGFWTPEYVEKKLAQFDAIEGVELLVAYDESLGVGEAIEARDHRAISYTGSVRVKDIRDALRRYEADLVAANAADLPAELEPEADVLTLAELAETHGVSEDAVETVDFPAHERVGRTLVRPSVLADLAQRIEPGMTLAEAEEVLDEYGIDDASAALSRLGYRVEWEGLGGGVIRKRQSE